MSFYLSESDKEFIAPTIERLRNHLKSGSLKDIVYETDNPTRLANIIRNAVGYYFKDLQGKFRIQKKLNSVVCSIVLSDSSNIHFSEQDGELEKLKEVENFENQIDQLGIIQYIITHQPNGVRFSQALLSNKDLERLTKFAEASGYVFDPAQVIFTKKVTSNQ